MLGFPALPNHSTYFKPAIELCLDLPPHLCIIYIPRQSHILVEEGWIPSIWCWYRVNGDSAKIQIIIIRLFLYLPFLFCTALASFLVSPSISLWHTWKIQNPYVMLNNGQQPWKELLAKVEFAQLSFLCAVNTFWADSPSYRLCILLLRPAPNTASQHCDYPQHDPSRYGSPNLTRCCWSGSVVASDT